MRKFSTALLTVLVLLCVTSTNAQVFKGHSAEKIIPGARIVRITPGFINPSYVQLRPGAEIAIEQLGSWMSQNFGTDQAMGYVMISSETDRAGLTHDRYQQTYNGIPLKEAVFVVHTDKGKLFSVNGTILSAPEIQNRVLLTESEALASALQYVHAQRYKWQMPEEEQLLKIEMSDPGATWFPKGRLVLLPVSLVKGPVPHLYCYQFDIYADKPLSRDNIFVDAASGKVVFRDPILRDADSSGTAVTKYSGIQPFVTDYYLLTFRLREADRGNGIETYDMNQGTSYGSAVDFTNESNYWNNVNAQHDEVATDAHWGAEMTYDYYMEKFGRNSIDGNGFKLKSYVHYDAGYNNAFWDGSRMTYGDGSGQYQPFTALDICGHEITHGVESFSANFVYQSEPGALSEGFSDVFGTAIEFFAKPLTANWTMGENIGSPFRSMSNPNSFQLPDTYQGNYWYSGTGDYGGVHTNCAVLGFWFYLCSQGGTGTNDNGDPYSVTAIGIDQAAQVAYRMLTVYLTTNSQYDDVQFYAVLSAIDLFGACSPQVETVTNALHAVGLGPAFVNGVVADFEAASTIFCTLPANVAFTNNSSNGQVFNWDFGDGTTSSQMNPLHTYTAAGNYTVTLAVDGGACGSDTVVKANYILIDTPLAPVTTSAANCGPASLTLYASAPDSILWYDAVLGGNVVNTGPVFTTPNLTQTTHYYVENSIISPSVYGGKANNSGGGGYYTSYSSHYLVFDCFTPVTLVSVKVYAGAAGMRTIELRDASGNTLQSASCNIPAGESRITLNFNVPAGTNLELAGPPNPNLYRNSGGTNFPYAVSSFINITSSSATTNPTGYYYYFYDWEVQESACRSARIPVTAFINSGNPAAAFTYSVNGTTVNFTNQSTDGNSFLWDFGDGTTSVITSPQHTYATTGNFTVNLAVTNACGNANTTQVLYISPVGTEEPSGDSRIMAYPNPASEKLSLEIFSAGPFTAGLSDGLGRLLWSEKVESGFREYTKNIGLQGFNKGVYFLKVLDGSGVTTRKVVIR